MKMKENGNFYAILVIVKMYIFFLLVYFVNRFYTEMKIRDGEQNLTKDLIVLKII